MRQHKDALRVQAPRGNAVEPMPVARQRRVLLPPGTNLFFCELEHRLVDFVFRSFYL